MSKSIAPFEPKPMKLSVLTAALQDLSSSLSGERHTRRFAGLCDHLYQIVDRELVNFSTKNLAYLGLWDVKVFRSFGLCEVLSSNKFLDLDSEIDPHSQCRGFLIAKAEVFENIAFGNLALHLQTPFLRFS